jgi:large subunit ribosomal protein L4
MEVAVYNAEGAKTSQKVKLPADIFGIEPNDHAIYLDVKRYLAAQRQGTHKSKQRNEISGSTRKLKRQKGTGGARAGSIKSPVFVGGGTVFGPQPRDYDQDVNKKVKRLARKSALTYKAKEDSILVLDALSMTTPKTKGMAGLLKTLKVEGSKTLVVLPSYDRNVYLSCRNLEGHKVITAGQLSTYDILNCKNLILVKDAIKVIEDQLNK